MPTWDDFKKSVGYYADKTAKKTRELTDTASLKIKIASKEADRDTEYKRLGKLTYARLKATGGESDDSLTREISEAIDKLDAISSELDSMRAEEERRRTEKEAEKAEKAAKNAKAEDTKTEDAREDDGESAMDAEEKSGKDTFES